MKSPFRRRAKLKTRYGELDSSSEHTELDMTEEFRIVSRARCVSPSLRSEKQDSGELLEPGSGDFSMDSSIDSQFDRVSLRILQKENDQDEKDVEHSKEPIRVRRTVELRKSISDSRIVPSSVFQHDSNDSGLGIEGSSILSDVQRDELCSPSRTKRGSRRRASMGQASDSTSFISKEDKTKEPDQKRCSSRTRRGSTPRTHSHKLNSANEEDSPKGQKSLVISTSRRRRTSANQISDVDSSTHREQKPRSASGRRRRTSMDLSCSSLQAELTPKSSSSRRRRATMTHVSDCTSPIRKGESTKEERPKSSSSTRRKVSSIDHAGAIARKVDTKQPSSARQRNSQEHAVDCNTKGQKHNAPVVQKVKSGSHRRSKTHTMDHSNSSYNELLKDQKSRNESSNRQRRKNRYGTDRDGAKGKKVHNMNAVDNEERTKRTSNRFRRSSSDQAVTKRELVRSKSESERDAVSRQKKSIKDFDHSRISCSSHGNFRGNESSMSLSDFLSESDDSVNVIASSYVQLDIASPCSERLGIKNHRRLVEN